jgi:hypothetical protein
MNLRKAVRSTNLRQWHAQSPANIARPLKAIEEKHPGTKVSANLIVEDPVYTRARRAARRGDGLTVKRIAREL